MRVWRTVVVGVLVVGPGLAGPNTRTPVRPLAPAKWQTFAGGAPSRLAVLLTDTTAPWLSLAHGLNTIGIPFEITRDYREALTHRVVLVYPIISGRALTGDALHALEAYDGTLIGTNVLGGGLNAKFGFTEAVPSRDRKTVTFAREMAFTDPRESTLPAPSTGTYGYAKPVDAPLATYDDGTAALTHHGHTYALGVDIGALLATGYGGRAEGMARSYDNDFEPTLDVWLRVLRRLYVDNEPNAVILGTVPSAKLLTVLITHDVDYTRSVENSLAYAAYEHDIGIPATYFVQTKYIRDYNDDVFFDDVQRPRLAQLHAMGLELASHSVAHTRQFAELPVGDGAERYPAYHPFVRDAKTTTGASVLGELRVSKFLLESVMAGDTVTAFRPGYLAYPRALPQALAAAGYHYSSSTTAASSLTHLPFALDADRAGDAESGVFEFPVSIEDEAPPRMDQRIAPAVALAHRIGHYGGELVVLIHPNVVDYKLRFEQGLVGALRDSAWFGTVSGFGRWWTARAGLRSDVTTEGATATLRLTSTTDIADLPITVPASWSYVSADAGVSVHPAGAHTLIVHAPAGTARIVFRSDARADPQ